ncbi:MAG: hypothetical protein GY811_24910 [Myxococcales bacterium]|nr:hypothetical protein [Myxococcales bacterium]
MKVLSLSLLAIAALGCSENRTPYGPDAGSAPAALECFPNLDGVLERSEMPALVDTAVSYLISEGTNIVQGSDELDLRSEFAGEQKISIQARRIGEQWFADSFPADGIVMPLSGAQDTFAILRSTDSTVRLLGIASELADHTLLIYESPIDIFRFPMEVGKRWENQSAVTGTLAAVPYNGTDTYEVAVEAMQAVSLPHLRFARAHKLRTRITSDSGAAGLVVTRQQISLLSECFGEITRIVSLDGDSADDFSRAAELWRFSL